MSGEYVILVNDQDQEIGSALKSEVHTDQTPLHRAFSIFIFNDKGEVVVQQRAKSKKTWPGIWSNSCCGHPAPGETIEAAIQRRVNQELRLKIQDLRKVADYRYRFEFQGVVENEICPIYRGVYVGAQNLVPNPLEVEDYRWLSWSDLLITLNSDTEQAASAIGYGEPKWSPWCKEEVKLFNQV